MTPVGVFFCWQGGAERDFVNSTILCQDIRQYRILVCLFLRGLKSIEYKDLPTGGQKQIFQSSHIGNVLNL